MQKRRTYNYYYPHIAAKEIRDIVGKELWANSFTFSIVRNPWDRFVSFFLRRMLMLQREHRVPAKSFTKFLKSTQILKLTQKSPLPYEGLYSCSYFVTDKDGKIIVDFIARYENRGKDLQYIGEKIGLPDFGENEHLWKTSDGTHYSRFYNDETREIVRKMYTDDIKLFGYEFEEG